MIRLSLILVTLSICPHILTAQEKPYEPSQVDEVYISELNKDFIFRIYGSNKFTRLSFGEYRVKEKVLYKPNDNYNVGFGFNYQWLALNIGFKAPFINDDNDKRGTTKYLDLQAYIYARKFVADLYAQTYEGYYFPSSRDELFNITLNQNLIRSDIQTRNIGFNVEYIFNHRKFSYRAAYLQNEYQKKSAGTFLAGFGAHYLNVRADSAIIPGNTRYPDYLGNDAFKRSSVGAFTVNGGYAYHLVLNEHFFLMGSLMLGAGVNSMTLMEDKTEKNTQAWSPTFNGIARAGVGYNSERYYVGVYFTTNLRQDEMPISNSFQRYETGVLRIALAKRFTLRPSIASRLSRTGLFE